MPSNNSIQILKKSNTKILLIHNFNRILILPLLRTLLALNNDLTLQAHPMLSLFSDPKQQIYKKIVKISIVNS